jgi:hypothetical protein
MKCYPKKSSNKTPYQKIEFEIRKNIHWPPITQVEKEITTRNSSSIKKSMDSKNSISNDNNNNNNNNNNNDTSNVVELNNRNKTNPISKSEIPDKAHHLQQDKKFVSVIEASNGKTQSLGSNHHLKSKPDSIELTRI